MENLAGQLELRDGAREPKSEQDIVMCYDSKVTSQLIRQNKQNSVALLTYQPGQQQ